MGEQRTLAACAQHFASFWNYCHLDNFHFFHYGDMQRDLAAAVRRIADILTIEVSDGRVGEICDAVSFSEMKKNASAFAPGAGSPHFKSDEDFFSSGKNAQWRDVLGEQEIAAYTRRINEVLTPETVAWVERNRCADPADLKRCIRRSRCRTGR